MKQLKTKSSRPKTMAKPVQTIIISESEIFAARLVREFRKSGIHLDCKRLSNLNEFKRQIEHRKWDLVLARRGFQVGQQAMELWQEKGLNIPFLIFPENCQEITSELTSAINSRFGDEFLAKTFNPASNNQQTESPEDQNNKFMHLIANATPSMLYVYDTIEKRILYVNSKVRTILGYNEDEFCRLGFDAFRTLIHPEDKNALEQHFRKVFSTSNDEVIEIQFRMKHADGNWRWLSCRNVVFQRNNEKRCEKILGTAEDITTRKTAELQMAQYSHHLRLLTSELLMTEERERREIADQLHDSLAQVLVFAKMEIQSLQRNTDEKTANNLDTIQGLIRKAIRHTRTLTFDISPPELYTIGFEAAIEELAERFSDHRGIQCIVNKHQEYLSLPKDMKILLYRSVRELLVNASKHSKADMIKIDLIGTDDEVTVTVEDNGIGFDPDKTNINFSNQKGFGLSSIRERLLCINGSFKIQTTIGEGVKVSMSIPINQHPLN